MKHNIIIKVELREDVKNLPGVEEWRDEVEKVFNSEESMVQLNTALAIITGASILELAGGS